MIELRNTYIVRLKDGSLVTLQAQSFENDLLVYRFLDGKKDIVFEIKQKLVVSVEKKDRCIYGKA